MEKSFDFGALLRNNEKKHKGKPTQFVSVAGGVQKRLQTTIKNRKSNRLTIFDKIRNLPACPSPDPVSEAQLKVEHRRQQLEKWKQEKEQKKKEAAAQKKKPFVAGVPHAPLKFVPPPPPPKPSSSGRVTRSQTAKSTITKRKPSPKQRTTKSFAPKNASFKPPELKNFVKLPALAPPSKTKKKFNLAFEPVLPNSVKHTRSRTLNTQTETKSTRKPVENRSISTVKGNGRKVTPKQNQPKAKRLTKTVQSSSSSSDIESSRIVNRIKTPGPGKSTKNVKNLTPKVLALSEESSSSSSESVKQIRKSLTSRSSNSLSSDSNKFSSDTDLTTSDQNTVIIKNTRKSVPSSLSPAISLDSSEKSSENDSYTTPNKLKRVPKSESSSEEKLRSPKSPVDLPLTPEQIETAKKISPCVTLSRGKDNARKEMKWKIDEGMLDDDTSDIENVDHFRRQLASEIDRMTEMCEAWDKVAEQTVLPEPVQESVLAAVGQARLLMSQKMQQFACLVERCARPDPATALVTPADLHGFWDMVFMQVENVDMRFKKLEEMRARNWVEDKPVVAARKVVKPPGAAAKKTRPAAHSRIRDMIAAARKAKKELDSSTSDSTTTTSTTSAASDSPSTKTFEAGFFSVRSPVKSPTTRTPNALLKAVLSSEAKKASASRNSASFAMLRASVLGKNVEYDGIAPLPQTPQMTPINLYATPGRSILKSSNLTSKSAKKSIKLVLFNESDNDLDALQELETKESTDPSIDSVEDIDLHTDSGLFSMDVDKNTEQKENNPKPRLVRQDAVECHVMTRSRRKSLQAQKPEIETETESKTEESTSGKTPRRTGRKKKSVQETEIGVKEKTPKKSTRKKALQEVESNVIEEVTATPKRSNRRRKSAPLLDLMT